jgi:predicted permease
VLLALFGGGAGLLLAAWGTELLVGLMPKGLLPSVVAISLDWHVLAFTLVAALCTGLLFGLAPAWQACNVEVNSVLKETGGKGGTGRRRLRGALVISEVALSLILLVGAGLLIRTFANLMGVTTGFDQRNVMTFQVALNGERYNTTNGAAAFYRDALERINRLPGVESAAITNKLPLDWQFIMPVIFPEQPVLVRSEQVRSISPDYFQVMKSPMQQGRFFNDSDNAGAPPVAIVNEAMAKRYFDGQDPFTRQLSIGRNLNDSPRQVIGVVGDVKQHGLDRPAPPMVYIPIPQLSDKLMATVRAFTSAHFTVRTTTPPLSLSADIKRELAQLDPTVPLSNISSMEQIAALSIATQRFHMSLLGLFGALGLLLATVGIYGVMAYSVTQRTNEIGIRIALGARASDVIGLVLRQGLSLVMAGTALGLGGAWALTRLMKTLLFEVSATDPITFVAVSVLFAGVALTACLVPARRAAKVDPMVALRYE